MRSRRRPQNPGGIVLVADEMQDRQDQDRHRLIEIDERTHPGMLEDRPRLPQVSADVVGVLVYREKCLSVDDGDGIVDRVDDPAVRRGGLGDVVVYPGDHPRPTAGVVPPSARATAEVTDRRRAADRPSVGFGRRPTGVSRLPPASYWSAPVSA